MNKPHGLSAEREIGVEVEGGRITGWMSGDGPRLLLLHGGPGLSEYLETLAAELAPAFTVFRYQQRGLAPSVGEGDRTVEGHVADAVRVLDGLGWDRAIIAGHSWGGHLAMHVVVAHPDRALGLAAIDALGAVGDGGEAVFEKNLVGALSDEEQVRYRDIEAREDAADAPPVGEPESLRILWPYYFGDPPTAPAMPPMLSDRPGSRTAWTSIHDHLERRTLEAGLSAISVPTIVIHGALDPIPAVEAEHTAALLPGAHLRILPGVGHFPWLEQPGSVLALMEEFVAGLPG
ncbi:MAG: alpha/beta fold hydrolase [Candidatus Limnocylindria bacterium]